MATSTTKTSLPNENSSILKQENQSPTATTRLLYLSSEQLEEGEISSGIPIKASFTLSPTHKIWMLPPIQDAVKQYKVNLRNLNIFHVWPSVKTQRTLTIGPMDGLTQASITIPPGNWDAYGLAEYINDQLFAANVPLVMGYDGARLGYIFTPSAHIYAPTDCQDLLGLPDGFLSTGGNYVEASYIPVRMSGPSRIHVNTNLSLHTFPNSGRLGTIPVDVNYGELLSYFDESGAQPSLCMDQHLSRIEVHLVDQDNNELNGYEEIDWGLVLSLTPEDNAGFESAADPFLRPETMNVVVEE